MTKKEYKVLGHKVNYNVTESSAEFNKLDPKRPDAANDEAVANIVYRSMNPDTRYWFLHGRSEEETKKLVEAGKLPSTAKAIVGVEEETGIDRKTEEVKGKDGKVRMRDGVAVTRFTEAEEEYYKRAIAELVNEKKFSSEEAVREHFQPLIEQIALEVPFDIVAAESAERGPKKLAAKYKLAAAKSLSLGTVDGVNANLLSKINKSFTPTGDTEKLFEGVFEHNNEQVPFKVSDKDAEAYGWLIKEYMDWKASQELLAM